MAGSQNPRSLELPMQAVDRFLDGVTGADLPSFDEIMQYFSMSDDPYAIPSNRDEDFEYITDRTLAYSFRLPYSFDKPVSFGFAFAGKPFYAKNTPYHTEEMAGDDE